MSEFVVSTRYANALMAASEENKSFDEVLKDISLIKNTLEASKELRNLLASPIISSDKKLEILLEIFVSKTGSDIGSFLKFIVQKGRENILFDVANRFIQLSNEKLGIVQIKITSAVELDESQKASIKDKLESMIEKKVVPNYEIDESIIGGFKARFKDTVIDASIQHQLDLLKKKLFEQDYLSN